MKKVVFASHVTTVDGKQYDGIGNALLDIFPSLTSSFWFVRHSMDGMLRSEVQDFKDGNIVKKHQLHVVRNPSALRYISELISTIFYFTFFNKVDVYIGIDPLNALAGIVLKKLGRLETAIFYTADYSLTRFNNKLLDGIYHRIDKFCVRHANEVWSVSSNIVDIRRSMGLEENKNIFLPNVPPDTYNEYRKNSHDIYSLITYGIVDKQLDYKGVTDAVNILKDEFPTISLTIIGNGPEEARLKKYVRTLELSDRIYFMGRLSLGETLKVASRSGIGLALYNGTWGFNQFGDSTKVREYFNFGLPVISTDTHSTVSDIRDNNAGIVTELSTESYVAAIRKVIKGYKTYSKNSLRVGKRYEGAHRLQLEKLLKD